MRKQAQRGPTARKGQSLGSCLLLCCTCPFRALGLPQVMPLARVERPRERAGRWEPKAESGSDQPGQSWSEQAQMVGLGPP